MARATAAFDAFEPAALAASAEQAVWQPGDVALPSIYLSHGAPPLFDDAGWMDELFAWSTSMPKPTGIVIVSAAATLTQAIYGSSRPALALEKRPQ